MPESKKALKEIKSRGGAIRYRRKTLPSGEYLTFAVTKEEGPRGGRTVAIETEPVQPKTKKERWGQFGVVVGRAVGADKSSEHSLKGHDRSLRKGKI